MKQKLLNLAERIEVFTEFTGKCVSWLVLVLVLIVGYDVFMRYVFEAGSISIQELEWHLFSIIFLLGASYTLKHDDHVRLDVFYRSRFLNERRRALIDVFGSLLILAPFCLLIIISSWPFVELAFEHNEASPDPGGLPARGLIKSAIPVGFSLLLLQGIAEALKKLAVVLRGEA